jgi:hypothetical protein
MVAIKGLYRMNDGFCRFGVTDRQDNGSNDDSLFDFFSF